MATRYAPGPLIGPATWQHLAPGFPVGERFHSVPVLRIGDAKPVHLGHAAQADGRWRLYAFADSPELHSPSSRLRAMCTFLWESEESPLVRFTPEGADPDAIFDVRAVLQVSHTSVDPSTLPSLLVPRKGRYGLIDYEKAFTIDTRSDNAFELRGVDTENGCLVVVRPDQYVAHVLPLDAYAELGKFFSRLLVQPHC